MSLLDIISKFLGTMEDIAEHTTVLIGDRRPAAPSVTSRAPSAVVLHAEEVGPSQRLEMLLDQHAVAPWVRPRL
jgi:hypothetical protein